MLLAVVFEETGAWQYKRNKEMERGHGGGGESTKAPGLEEGFEEVFSFGEEDDNDYWDKTITDENGNVIQERVANAWQ